MRRRRYDLAQALYCKACILQEERRIGAGYVFKPKCIRTHSTKSRYKAPLGELERLCCYITRPVVSTKRLSMTRIRYDCSCGAG